MRLLIALLVVLFIAPALHAQEETPPVVPTATVKFKRSILKAVRTAKKNGDITAAQSIRLRVALMSPAFQRKAEDLAVTQMAFGQSDDDAPLPTNEDGSVDRTAIDWEGLGNFLMKLLPLLLELLDAFAVAQPVPFSFSGV